MDIRYLKGVGEKRAAQLAKLGIFTVDDLLGFYPRDYVDYSRPYPVASAPYDVKCVVRATVYGKGALTRIRGGKQMVKILAGDDTAGLSLVYFNNPYISQKLEVGTEYCFFGKVGGGFAQREMVNPVMLTAEAASATPLVPVYPQTEGINSNYLAKCMRTAFAAAPDIPEPLPAWMLQKYRLCPKADAVRMIHFPRSTAEIASARRRLIFEELLALQLGLLLLRSRDATLTGAPMKPVDLQPFWASLPFSPTGAQKRAAQEILADFNKLSPMNRLLQGDVGSGKTLVAAAGIYAAWKNGYQSALMAPTEILAAQHAETLRRMLEPLGVRVALLTGSVKGAAKKAVRKAIAEGEADLVVGTHAVLGPDVEFRKLGFAVTDEQHRFGVRQRSALAGKADHPHLLVMSATPIPRTLGLLMFGDLDISILDELPPGRTPVKTYAITGKKRADMYGFLKAQLAAGRQAYIVCPVIDESETDMQSVTSYYEETARPLLEGYRVGLMHGRLKAAEKNAVMQQFKDGELDVLVSTTVIEVGVDVPNANLIVIENAERYGLSALHQLRGRVGRGKGEAYCILISDHTGEAVKKRLSFLCHTTDGFAIAKFDLETRGPGDFFGSRQHGLPSLHIADLMADSKALYAAQQEAIDLVAADPGLRQPENAGLRALAEGLFREQTALN
ncbi:ATP-dependent DNA helicase RecG [Ruthenibacterium sp. CLA-JM-H11]|uniref:ATP-dependent DNA helicase RecG n=1 Tax=Ruthenibacterium intestinale TaxID=3133163 RepID=A0ABV1GDY2_9FIRM